MCNIIINIYLLCIISNMIFNIKNKFKNAIYPWREYLSLGPIYFNCVVHIKIQNHVGDIEMDGNFSALLSLFSSSLCSLRVVLRNFPWPVHLGII